LNHFLYGTLGTLGNQWDKEFLREKLKLGSFPIPSHMQSRVVTYPTKIVEDTEKWKASVVKEANDFCSLGRALLIICRDINTAMSVDEIMRKDYPEAKIIQYWRNDTQALPKRVSHFDHFLSNSEYILTVIPIPGIGMW
jgi:hypothetical protein